MPTFLYLHGFASGPSSTKAQFFAAQLDQIGVEVVLPDLNGKSFENLTLSNQLEIIDAAFKRTASDAPSVIFGSSMGGLLATMAQSRYRSVKAIVLLAPGFGLPRRWVEQLGDDGVKRWREQGFTQVFHYGANRNERLNYNFIADACSYATDNLKVTVPTLVFHGKNDETVPVSESIDFANNNRDLVQLHLLDSDHALIDCIDTIWERTYEFLKVHSLVPIRSSTGSNQV